MASKTIITLSILLAFFTPKNSNATCNAPTVRIDQSGGSMANVNTTPQGDLGICYACVAAQVAATVHGQQNVCPLAVAADMVAQDGDQRQGDSNALEGASTCRAIRAGNRAGYCQNCGPFYDALKRADGGNEFFDRLDTFFRVYRENIAMGDESPNWNELINDYHVLEFNRYVCSISTEPALRLSLVLPTKEVLIRSMVDESPGHIFKNFVDLACNPRTPGPNQSTPACNETDSPTYAQAQNMLRSQFTSSSSLPLGISYCANVFRTSEPESFMTMQQDPIHNKMYEIFDYNSRASKAKWATRQMKRRMLGAFDRYITRLENDSNDRNVPQRLRTPRQKTLEYVREIRRCTNQYLAWLENNPASELSISTFFDGEDLASEPMKTITDKVTSDICATTIAQKRAAIPATDSYSSQIREDLSGEMNRQERMARSERTCKRHVSLLIGQRCHNGKMQYLLRNSWGQDCDGYRHGASSNSECEADASSIWMDEDVIINNTYRYQKFE